MCNKNCFACTLPDCENDDLSLAEYQEDIIPQEVPRQVEMNRIRANRYTSTHREITREKAMKYYRDNKEKDNKRVTKWVKENKDRVATAKRERYQRNIEVERQKQRDYRARKKEGLKV